MGRRQAVRLFLLLASALAWPATASASDPFRELDLIRPSRSTLAPDFTVSGLESRPLRLREFTGKVILLNFWATWCPPCKEEMPSMERLYQRYRDRDFTILAISIDTQGAGAVAQFVRTFQLTFPIGLDPKMEVADRYTVRALPTTFLIDKSGGTVGVAMGPRDWDSRAAHAAIDSLLRT